MDTADDELWGQDDGEKICDDGERKGCGDAGERRGRDAFEGRWYGDEDVMMVRGMMTMKDVMMVEDVIMLKNQDVMVTR